MCVFVIWCDEVQKNTNKMESCCNALIPFLLLTLCTFQRECGGYSSLCNMCISYVLVFCTLVCCISYVLVTVLYISLLYFKVFPVILYLKHT